MTGGPDKKDERNTASECDLQEAISRSDRELKMIANFYHQHGYTDCAQEIYQTMFKIRTERNHLDDRIDEERQKQHEDRSAKGSDTSED